jgi:hypothetical protein
MAQGDKNAADQAAVDMMRKVLSTVRMNGVVVIGEGEKDVRSLLSPLSPIISAIPEWINARSVVLACSVHSGMMCQLLGRMCTTMVVLACFEVMQSGQR